MIIVSSFLLLLSETPAKVSAFDYEDKAGTANHNNHRRKAFQSASATSINKRHGQSKLASATSINKRHGQSKLFDAMALAYYKNSNDFIKEGSSRKKTLVKQKNISRQLVEEDGLLATRTFPECIEESLSPEECQDSIQQQIEDAGGHEIGDVNVKIHTPRTPEQFAESYWMVEVPVNLYAKMTCDRNDGKTFYPLKWTDGMTGTTLDVEDQDCYGLSAGECCLKLRSYGKQLTTSGYDEQKQCLSCFVHQEPLEPVVNEETGETDYLECKVFENGNCIREQLKGAEVDALDLQTVGRIETAIASLESFQADRSCDTFDQLLEELYNAATVIPPLSIKIGRLACMVCYGIHDLSFEDNFITFQLAEILMMMKRYSPPMKQIDSKENCIIIYTNSDGEVVTEPKLGGSRSDMIGKETVPHVAPAPTPTVAPVKDDDGLSLCEADTDCDDTEWCDRGGTCLENVCITNPPEDCQGEDKMCIPSPYEYYDFYRCKRIDCFTDPSICSENEYCNPTGDYYYGDFFVEEIYECEEYKDVGEDCGVGYYGYYYGQAIFDGECNPDVSFCLEPYTCTYTASPYIAFARRCVAYGEGSCLDEDTGEITQANCNDDEYCDVTQGRCKPNRNAGECCSPELNNCGYGTELGSLICAPAQKYVDYYGYVIYYHVCQKECDTDDDCGNNEWCAPVDHRENSPPDYPGKFCMRYKGLNDYCEVNLPGLVGDLERNNEERCDPSTSYCYDPTFCLKTSEYYFESQCKAYGNECTSDSDCADATIEWCDVNVGYCKDRTPDCCTTAGDENKNDCESGLSCEPTEGDSYNPGAALCVIV